MAKISFVWVLILASAACTLVLAQDLFTDDPALLSFAEAPAKPVAVEGEAGYFKVDFKCPDAKEDVAGDMLCKYNDGEEAIHASTDPKADAKTKIKCHHVMPADAEHDATKHEAEHDAIKHEAEHEPTKHEAEHDESTKHEAEHDPTKHEAEHDPTKHDADHDAANHDAKQPADDHMHFECDSAAPSAPAHALRSLEEQKHLSCKTESSYLHFLCPAATHAEITIPLQEKHTL